MKRKFIKKILQILFVFLYGCNSFLDTKPDANISTPENLEDLRALLDNEASINRDYPGLLEMGTDDYFIDYSVWTSREAFDQDVYLWKPDPVYQVRNTGQYWTSSYGSIATANVVLEALKRLGLEETEEGKRIKGEALFIRGMYLFHLVQVFAPTYEKYNANGMLGVPLKLASSVDQVTFRATLQETYDQIIGDISTAAGLLPRTTEYLTRATVSAAHAVLSRVYLFMGNYQESLSYAEEVLNARSDLLDYNRVDVDHRTPFPPNENPEMLYFATSASASTLLFSSRANVDTLLFDSFSDSDLRKSAYFAPKGGKLYSFKGFYSGTEVSYFCGLATDELYLNKAECLVRLDRVDEGIEALNHLLSHRWETGKFVAYQLTDRNEALKVVLQERRKEMIRRGVRWSDLKRLNKEKDFAVTLVRELKYNGEVEHTELPPGDPRYIYLIPQDVVELTKIPQNPR